MKLPPKEFTDALCNLINKHSVEGLSDTPDYFLADYLSICLANFSATQNRRDQWYGINQKIPIDATVEKFGGGE